MTQTQHGITNEQKKVFVDFINLIIGPSTKLAIDEMDAIIPHGPFQEFLYGDKATFRENFGRFIREEIARCAPLKFGCLKLISGAHKLTIKRRSRQVSATELNLLFSSVDSKFAGLKEPTSLQLPTPVQVYEMEGNGTFKDMFCAFPANLKALCLKPAGIVQFVCDYKDWLRGDDFATFFLTRIDGKYQIVLVRKNRSIVKLRLDKLDQPHVWEGKYAMRLVVPSIRLIPSV